MKYSPIILFTYKRLDSLKQTIEALKNNSIASESELFVFSDGPKNKKDKAIVDNVRSYLKDIDGFKNITINESIENRGLAKSIIKGVSEVINDYGKAIVLEDDLLTTPNFLEFMNKSLGEYQNNKKVFSISGYSFDLNVPKTTPADTYFLPRGWSWGWATWKDKWEGVDWEVSSYSDFRNNKKQKSAFAKGGSDLNEMLKKQMNGVLDSWAIRWFFHQYKAGGFTLYPVYSKVYNIGFDKDATHTTGSDKRYRPLLDTTHHSQITFPDNIVIEKRYSKPFLKKMGILSRIQSKLDNLLFTIFKK